MKKNIVYTTCWIFILIVNSNAHAQLSQPLQKKTIYVIVHGAWGGSWAFKKVDSLLTEKNAVVYRPSLTGLGERVHLANGSVGLITHIQDVVNMILFENLHEVVLVGHSYGGMVITGVADSIPERISRMIYLDAFVPYDGENLLSIAGGRANSLKHNAVNGFIVPAWVKTNQMPPKDVPHPLKTFTDIIKIKNAASSIRTVYILTVAKGINAKDDDFGLQALRAGKRGWKVLQLEADHNPQWSVPEKLVELLHANK